VPRVTRRDATAGAATTVLTPGPWTVTFPGGLVGSPALGVPGSWEADEATRFLSGVVTYETRIDVPASAVRRSSVVISFGQGTPVPEAPEKGPGMRAWLDGPVREAAVVHVNGARAGAVWSPPWELDITPHLKPGANALRIEVGNTAMNAMAGRPPPDDRLLMLRYGDRFQPQDMDQVRPLPSGLTGTVTVRLERSSP
jgi:hypothetical protein